MSIRFFFPFFSFFQIITVTPEKSLFEYYFWLSLAAHGVSYSHAARDHCWVRKSCGLPANMTLVLEQCEGANIFALVLVLVLHGSLIVLCRTSLHKRLCIVAMTAAMINVFVVRHIVFLTIMHQIMGMMASEAAVRMLRCPLVLATSWADAASCLVLFVPNLLIVVGEIFVAIRVEPLRLAFFCGPSSLHDCLEHFGSVPFYQKQHAVLHAVLCVLILSVSTSLRPSWRRSPMVQQARILVEPSCLVSVASILFTHHHGTHKSALASHPMIGTLMCLGALIQVLAYLTHVAVAAAPPPAAAKGADGTASTSAGVDVTQPMPNGGPPVLRATRALQAYVYLLLGYFLYVDTFMEYLGCRNVLLKVDPLAEGTPDANVDSGWAGQSLGLSPDSELSTYVALGVVCAALALSCILLCGPGAYEAGRDLYARDAEQSSQLRPLLLPPVSPPTKEGEQDPEGAAGAA